MKICLFTDFRFVTGQAATGVTKHAYFMAKGLMADARHQVSALVAADQIGRQGCLDFLTADRLPLPWKVARELWTWTDHPAADRWTGDADWVYCPKNDWIPLRKVKYAVTIHGAHELDPSFRKTGGFRSRYVCARTRSQYLKMCERADVVFTVSEWLKNFVVEQFHADPNKIVVVGNGVDPAFYEAGRKKVLKFESPRVPKSEDGRSSLVHYCGNALVGGKGALGNPQSAGSTNLLISQPATPPSPHYSLPTNELMNSRTDEIPYILCVGGLNHIDGGDRIIALGHEIRRSGKQIRIKVAGCQHEPGTERLAAETGVIDLLGYVPHAQLAGWMADAAVFYFPTRYETFGMAAAEAMAAGCPVVTSRCTAVPEIVGNCGLYVDADRSTEVLHAVHSLIKDQTASRALCVSGRERAKQFTWDGCVLRLTRSLS